jgi:hypothetical protein
MADVSDVHHVLDAVTKEFKCAAKDVSVQEGPEVTDMRVVVDGWATGVESQVASSNGTFHQIKGARSSIL